MELQNDITIMIVMKMGWLLFFLPLYIIIQTMFLLGT